MFGLFVPMFFCAGDCTGFVFGGFGCVCFVCVGLAFVCAGLVVLVGCLCCFLPRLRKKRGFVCWEQERFRVRC